MKNDQMNFLIAQMHKKDDQIRVSVMHGEGNSKIESTGFQVAGASSKSAPKAHQAFRRACKIYPLARYRSPREKRTIHPCIKHPSQGTQRGR
jgi:hypothetical protein